MMGDDAFMVKNLFRELSMAEVKGYKDLTEHQKDLFDTVYKRHLASMNFEKRSQYTEVNLEEVHPDGDDLVAHFNNGNKFKYMKNKTWQKIT